MNGQPSCFASNSATVVLPLPDTPMTISAHPLRDNTGARLKGLLRGRWMRPGDAEPRSLACRSDSGSQAPSGHTSRRTTSMTMRVISPPSSTSLR